MNGALRLNSRELKLKTLCSPSSFFPLHPDAIACDDGNTTPLRTPGEIVAVRGLPSPDARSILHFRPLNSFVMMIALRLRRSTKRLLTLLALLPVAVLLMGSLYMLGMEHLEGSPRTFLESLQWATETLTTTGYGNDSHWRHPVIALFVICGQFLGQFLVFLIFPVFVLPYFEERFEVRLPNQLPPMAGKVLFYRYGPAIEHIVEEFHRTRSPFVIFENDLDVARGLRDRGLPVVFGRLNDHPTRFERARHARAIVCNAGDHGNAECTLAVREHGYTGSIFALADDPLYRAPLVSIGASEVFTPAHVLGGALAARASSRMVPPAEGLHLLGQGLVLDEVRVPAGSLLVGRVPSDCGLRETHGLSVAGFWHGGQFISGSSRMQRIEAGAILLVAGKRAAVEAFGRENLAVSRKGPVVIAGFGTVGRKVLELLRDAGERCVVIDRLPGDDVGVVGNVLERQTLERAGVADASAVVLALNDDSEALFATAALREFAPAVPIVARVGRTQNIERLYRAGADFAISVGQVAGQILAYHLLDEQGLPVDTHLRIARYSSGHLQGLHPIATLRDRSLRATLIAVERAGDIWIDFPADFRLAADDTLYVCGGHEDLQALQLAFSLQPIHSGQR